MHTRTVSCAALAAAGLLALPAVAGAAGSNTVVAGPLKVKDGYSLTLMATDGGARDSLDAVLTRTAGKSTQMHDYAFAKGVKVAVKGTRATIKGSLGRFGRVDLKLIATKRTRGVVPKGCTGKAGATWSGTATGQLKLVADKTYFRTISAKRLPASILGASKLRCGGGDGAGNGGGGAHGVTLMKTIDTAASTKTLVLSAGGGAGVSQMVSVIDKNTAPARVSHIITARAGASGLQAASDLSSATAAGAAPFLGGTLRFAGDAFGSMATGTLSGDFTAKFDSIGRIAFASDEPDAMLMRR
jgi:hypothetical protein